ncbi:MAG: cell division protein ZapE, partial [Pseudomonadota bacterium]
MSSAPHQTFAPANTVRPNTVRTDTVLARYESLVSDGSLEADEAQIKTVRALDRLNVDLAERRLANKKSSLGWLFSKRKSAWSGALGLYVWGGVGRGKTMLMDWFFECSPIRRKKRVHFHEFMADVHERIHNYRERAKRGEVSGDDPLGPVSDDIAKEVRLLCFDEFTVRDVADAAIMRRLFTGLFAHNVVIVATSNVAPKDLYKDGLRRGDFLPFIDLLKENVNIIELNARTDFRLEKLGDQPVYSHPLNTGAEHALDQAWRALIGNAAEKTVDLPMKGRVVHVPRAALGAARFTFSDL